MPGAKGYVRFRRFVSEPENAWFMGYDQDREGPTGWIIAGRIWNDALITVF
jgi:hypothetical protein